MSDNSTFWRDTWHVPLSKRERRVLAILWEEGDVPVAGKFLAERCDFDFEPHAVRVLVSKIRRKLAGTGWTITGNTGGAHGSFGVYNLTGEV